MGGPDALIDVDFAVTKHIKIFEGAKLETHSGRFLGYEGQEVPW